MLLGIALGDALPAQPGEDPHVDLADPRVDVQGQAQAIGHRAARLVGTLQIARVDGVEPLVGEALGEGLGLGAPLVVEGGIEVALDDSHLIGDGFAMAN
ncbi:hypothetical protein D3C87_1852510 [compost metagenome]